MFAQNSKPLHKYSKSEAEAFVCDSLPFRPFLRDGIENRWRYLHFLCSSVRPVWEPMGTPFPSQWERRDLHRSPIHMGLNSPAHLSGGPRRARDDRKGLWTIREKVPGGRGGAGSSGGSMCSSQSCPQRVGVGVSEGSPQFRLLTKSNNFVSLCAFFILFQWGRREGRIPIDSNPIFMEGTILIETPGNVARFSLHRAGERDPLFYEFPSAHNKHTVQKSRPVQKISHR